MEKIAISLINHKGGVGKTTLAVILSQIALQQDERVICVDLDPQRNFTDAMSFIQERYGSMFSLTNGIQEADALSGENDIIILDCPPALGKISKQAISYSDITLIPVLPDLFSLTNLRVVYEFGEEHSKAETQMPLVKVGYDKRGLSEMAHAAIEDHGYPVAGEVPINRLIPFNIASGRLWSSGIPVPARKPYISLFKAVLRAYQRMLSGEMANIWEEDEHAKP